MICSIVTEPFKYNSCILFNGLPYMYVTINYNIYTICIRNTARSKSIALMCTHVYSYMFSTVHPPRNELAIKYYVYMIYSIEYIYFTKTVRKEM